MSVYVSALSGLFLVLPLCGSREIFQYAPQVLKGGPVLRAFPPAHAHDIIKPIRTVFRLWHSVAALQVLNYLWIGHTCTTHTFSSVGNVCDVIQFNEQQRVKGMYIYQGKVCGRMSLFLLGGSQMTTRLILW